MKTNQLDVMRKARERALKYQKINFTTIHIATPDKKKNAGSITAAYKQIEPVKLWEKQPIGTRYFRVQFSFCSPQEKNPSRVFGEGQAALRWSNDKSALVLTVHEGESFMDNLKQSVLVYASHRSVPWMKKTTIKDLV